MRRGDFWYFSKCTQLITRKVKSQSHHFLLWDIQNFSCFSLTDVVFDIKQRHISKTAPPKSLNLYTYDIIVISLPSTQSFCHAWLKSCPLFGRIPWNTNFRGWVNASFGLSSQSPRRHRQQEAGDASLEMLLVFEVSHTYLSSLCQNVLSLMYER